MTASSDDDRPSGMVGGPGDVMSSGRAPLSKGSSGLDQQEAEAVDLGALAGVDEGRAVELLDNRGPLHHVPGSKTSAIVDGAVGEVAGRLEEDAALRDDGAGDVAHGARAFRQDRRIGPPAGHQSRVDHLDRLVPGRITGHRILPSEETPREEPAAPGPPSPPRAHDT